MQKQLMLAQVIIAEKLYQTQQSLIAQVDNGLINIALHLDGSKHPLMLPIQAQVLIQQQWDHPFSTKLTGMITAMKSSIPSSKWTDQSLNLLSISKLEQTPSTQMVVRIHGNGQLKRMETINSTKFHWLLTVIIVVTVLNCTLQNQMIPLSSLLSEWLSIIPSLTGCLNTKWGIKI